MTAFNREQSQIGEFGVSNEGTDTRDPDQPDNPDQPVTEPTPVTPDQEPTPTKDPDPS